VRATEGKDLLIWQLRADLAQRDAAIAQREATIALLQTELEQRDQAMALLQTELEQRKARTLGLQTELEQHTDQLAVAQARVAELQAQLLRHFKVPPSPPPQEPNSRPSGNTGPARNGARSPATQDTVGPWSLPSESPRSSRSCRRTAPAVGRGFAESTRRLGSIKWSRYLLCRRKLPSTVCINCAAPPAERGPESPCPWESPPVPSARGWVRWWRS
jgi:hypothetical protein